MDVLLFDVNELIVKVRLEPGMVSFFPFASFKNAAFDVTI